MADTALPNIHADPAGYLERVLGRRVDITSGQRSAADNARVGGVPTSSHLTGNAWDFVVPGLPMSQAVQMLLAAGIPFDQIINEGDHVHIGVDPRMRHQVFSTGAGAHAMPAALDQALQTQRGAQSAAVSDPMLQQALQQHAALSAQRNASADKLQPLADRATALASQPTEAVPEPPSLRDLPEAPKAPQTDKMRVFGQLMPVLAAFGSLMTRGGAVNALNTATAAMNAAKAKDDDAYEKSRQQWLDHTEEALKQNAVEMERYRAVLDKHHETVSDKMAELQGIAAANNDQLTLERLRSGNLDEFEKIIGMRDQAAGRLTDLVESERSHDERQQQLKMEQQRIDLSKRAEDFQEKYGVPVDRKILDDFHTEHPHATAEEEAQFMGSFAASKRITAQQLAQSGLSADAQKFVDDYQNLPESGDPAKETLEFKGHKFTKAQIDQALGTQFPTQEQKEIAEIFKQAMKPIIPNSFSGAAPGDQQQHAPAGVADLPAGDKPPADHPDAKKAPDGHWYVKKGDQFYLVGE